MGVTASEYRRDGFVSPVQLLSREEAHTHRAAFEAAERRLGDLHYVSKVHTIFPDAAALATDPRVLDLVESLLGPDVLLFDVTYIVKEPGSRSHVTWHQDLTYWGFSGDEQVSMWLALSPATHASGCMSMVPGSHAGGRIDHDDVHDPTNVLHRGQTARGVDEARAVPCPLEPGQASFHHGWTLHMSNSNTSDDRRIGLNAQYIAPSMRQLVNPDETALLVRGGDPFGHYAPDTLAREAFDVEALARHAELDRRRKATWEAAPQAR